MRSGFPNGAEARWRTLYELAVTAEVLRVGGRQVAGRFENHRFVFLAKEGNRLFPDTEVGHRSHTLAVRECNRLVRRYGDAFAGNYGWAAVLTGRRLNKLSPSFSDLESLTESKRFTTLRQFANHHTHADALGGRLLYDEQGSIHHGSKPFDLGEIAGATADCLTVTASAVTYSWANYVQSDPSIETLRFLSDEIQLVATRNARASIPSLAALNDFLESATRLRGGADNRM